MVEYNYDAWGRHTVSGSNVALGNKNPFRYRGYYYDTETELYYLQSRYYDPKLCRFINMDSIEYAEPERINGLNLFAYCGNNPVMFVDPSGTNPFVQIWNSVTQPFVDVWKWFDKNVNEPIDNFFNKTLPEFMFGKSDALEFVENSVPKFFTETIPNFFVNTVWNDWIVDKIYNKGLVPAWNWVSNNWKTVADWGVAILGGITTIVGIVGLFVSLPLWCGISSGIIGLGAFVWTIGRLSGGW